MTSEYFKQLTGFDPTKWVATKKEKHYANGQFMEFDAKRISLEVLVKRCEPIEGETFQNQMLKCIRIFRGSVSYYTFYIDGTLKCDVTSESSYLNYLSLGHPQEDALKFASFTYEFEEVEKGIDVVEGIDLQWELISIDRDTFKIVNKSFIDGAPYSDVKGFRHIVHVGPEKLPIMNGLLVMTDGVKADSNSALKPDITFATRYDIEADGYICELENEDLIVTLTCGSQREVEHISAKLIRTENGWNWQEVNTPLTHQWGKRKFIRIADFREAGLI